MSIARPDELPSDPRDGAAFSGARRADDQYAASIVIYSVV